MTNLFTVYQAKSDFVTTESPATARIFDLMLAKGDLPTYEKLKRPRTNKFKAVTFSDFLEARVIPSSLYEGALMTTGQWYFNNYKNWFDDFVWQVIRRYKAAMRMRGIDEQIGDIIDEEPGAYFFVRQIDAYRNLRDPWGITSNAHEIFRSGHTTALLFVLTYADLFFKERAEETGEPNRDCYDAWDIHIGHARGSAPGVFRHEVLNVSYSKLRSETTESAIRAWNRRTIIYENRPRH